MNSEPSDIVAFLFTDIQDSTRLAQEHAEQWESMLARHDSILKSAIEGCDGRVFQSRGDGFCAAFHTAGEAVRAAIEAQTDLYREQGQTAPIKVRMGIHAGAAELQADGQYHGYLTLSRVQRVMSVAHGGQVLLSSACAELLQNNLPAGIRLRDMKEHRLKGLPDLEHLWQLVVPGLQQDFPRLESLTEIPNNLPVQLTSFIGRDHEIKRIKSRLENNRLVTLTGPGGIGKTRLSIQVAFDLLTEYPDGAWLVELAPIMDPALVARTVCTALDVTQQSDRPALRVLSDYLKLKKILLVLDNCEHLIDASAELCDTLLRACPHVRILASSREALRIDGESVYRVPPLSLPSPQDGLSAIEASEAVKLFIERATAASPEFEITENNAPAVAQICEHLDGIALAIELAASRTQMLSVEQIAAHLDDRFRLLRREGRTALPRQRTLRALIDWSYNLLSEPERTVLQQLSVFAGGWTLEAAETVCGNPDILDLLARLVDKSLVAVDWEHGDEPRYYLLETIRQYAREQLRESGSEDAVRTRHLAYHVQLVERAEPNLYRSDQILWFKRLRDEIDNLRSTLDWAVATDVESGLRIAAIPFRFWDSSGFLQELGGWLHPFLERYVPVDRLHALGLTTDALWLFRRGHFTEAISRTRQSLQMARELSNPQLVGFNLSFLGLFTLIQGNVAEGMPLLEQALVLQRAAGDKIGQANTLEWLSIDHTDPQRAIAFARESLSLYRELDNLTGIASVLVLLSRLTAWSGDYDSPVAWLEEALSIARRLRDRPTEAAVLVTLGIREFWQGHYSAAVECFEEGLQLSERIGDHYSETWIQIRMAHVFLRQGELRHAQRLLTASLEDAHQANFMIAAIYAIEGWASLHALETDDQPAIELYAWADAMRKRIGDPRPLVEQAAVERELDTIRSRIPPETFQAALERGSTMTAEQAMALAAGESISTR